MFDKSFATYTNGVDNGQGAMSIDDVVAAYQKIEKEPIGEWMRKMNRPPEHWHVVLPESCRPVEMRGFGWPNYVSFSSEFDVPVFRPRAGPLAFGEFKVFDKSF